jgi:phycocyanobilin lyase beta subunit
MTTEPIFKLIQAVEDADSPLKLLRSVQALAAQNHEAAIPVLIRVLGYNNPGAAVAAVEGLVVLGAAAVPALLDHLDGYNYGARAWAIRALSRIGDPRALDTLSAAACQDFALSVRRAAAKGLGSVNWRSLPDLERRQRQQETCTTLLQVCKDPEWVVRYAAVVGLESLLQAIAPTNPGLEREAQQTLRTLGQTDPVLTIRARSQYALQTLDTLQVAANC